MSRERTTDRGRRRCLGAMAAWAVCNSVSHATLSLNDDPPESAGSADREKIAALLRSVLVTDDAEVWRLVTDAYADCVLGKFRPADAPLMHPWIVPGGGYYAQWLWDTMFVLDLLAVLPGQKETIRGVFQNYWDFQQRWNRVKPDFMHGMVANFMAPFDAPEVRPGKAWETFPAYSQAPLLAWGMERVYRRNRDSELVRAGLQPQPSSIACCITPPPSTSAGRATDSRNGAKQA